MATLAGSPDALDTCARFVLRLGSAEDGSSPRARDGGDGRNRGSGGGVMERSARRVLRLYCAFKDGRSVRDVLLESRDGGGSTGLVEALDHRAFVAFGVVHGVLRRVHRYPTAFPPPAPRFPPSSARGARVARLFALMDGTVPMDGVSRACGRAPDRVDAEIAAAGGVVVDVYK